MTAGRELNRLLWAVGEAHRLRRSEVADVEGGTHPSGDRQDLPVDQPEVAPAR